jgi:signal transduction histidine kinase
LNNAASILRDLPEVAPSDERLLAMHPLVQTLIDAAVWEEDDRDDPYRATLTALHRFVNVQSISLLLYNGHQAQLVLTAATGQSKSNLPDERYRLEDSLSGEALQQHKAVLSNSLPVDPRTTRKWFSWWSDKLRPSTLQHGVFVPIRGDLELQCVLRFFNRLGPDGELSDSGFTDRDMQTLEFLAKLLTVKLNEIWVADRLYHLGEALSSILSRATVEEVASQVSRTAVALGNAAACSVYLIDAKDGSTLRMSGSYGFQHTQTGIKIPIDHSLAGRVVRSGKTLEVEDLQSSEDASPLGPGKRDGMATFVGFPLSPKSLVMAPGTEKKIKSAGRGVVAVYSRTKRKFHPSTLSLLQQFVLSTGSIMDNRRLLEESDWLRETLALAAHSVRSPLTQVTIALEQIQQKDGTPAKFAREMQTAWINLELANARLSTMLYSKPELLQATQLDISRFNIHDIVSRCVNRHAATAAERSIEIDLREEVSRLGKIKGDRDKLDLVFDNLLENATKYSWQGQTIVVSGERTANSVRISIADRGLGISEIMREKIFDSLVRSDVLDRKRHIKGTGLGLYVSRLIVDAHGGAIKVKSVPFLDDPERRLALDGYETTFTVTLPIDGA